MDTKIMHLLTEQIIVLNIGLGQFARNMEEQGVEVVQVDWTPPAGGDKEMLELLDNLL
jgi:FdrA protein